MVSVVVSFVGSQDPWSDRQGNPAHQEGSLVTLIRFLHAQGCTVARVVLLHTADLVERVQLCREWLAEDLHLDATAVVALPVSDALSTDPIDTRAAVAEARRGLELAATGLAPGDRVEMNASSGTPAMKSAWNLLQAAGYAPTARVWQVRDPARMGNGQARVFESDTSYLRDEFDARVIARQVGDFNYAGALGSLEQSRLGTPLLLGLLRFGRFRLAFDFNRAFDALVAIEEPLRAELTREIAPLRQGRSSALLRELYYNALVKLAVCEYSDFLGRVFRFQEAVLRHVAQELTGLTLERSCWLALDRVDGGKLRAHLERYRLPSGDRLNLGGDFNRRTLEAILEHYRCNDLLAALRVVNDYSDLRNRCIVAHGYEGLSEIRDVGRLTRTMHEILVKIGISPGKNPFEALNFQILHILRL
jgi:hypothetical protein